MKISEHIKQSLDAADRKDLDQAMLSACIAIDGTSEKTYPNIDKVGKRFRKFINDNLDIIELMHGGLDLKQTLFPFKNGKGHVGVCFADIVYEQFRCKLAHGAELAKGYGITFQFCEGHQNFQIDIENQFMTLPQSVIYALGLSCVLAPANADQKIGNTEYYYRDPINTYVVDHWWGKVDCARKIMDFDSVVKVKFDFSKVWPSS